MAFVGPAVKALGTAALTLGAVLLGTLAVTNVGVFATKQVLALHEASKTNCRPTMHSYSSAHNC